MVETFTLSQLQAHWGFLNESQIGHLIDAFRGFKQMYIELL